MITPTFKAMSSGSYNLQDITVVGDNVTGDGDVVIQIMSSDGQWVGEYCWFTEDGWGAPKNGWYTYDDTYATVTLKTGEAIFVSCDNEEVKFQVAGQVSSGDSNDINVGYTMSGNSSPVDLDLQNLKPSGENITGDGDIVVQVMSSDGQWVGEYCWFTQDGWGAEKDGWYTYDDDYAEVTLAPGKSVFVSCDNSDVVFNVPGAMK